MTTIIYNLVCTRELFEPSSVLARKFKIKYLISSGLMELTVIFICIMY